MHKLAKASSTALLVALLTAPVAQAAPLIQGWAPLSWLVEIWAPSATAARQGDADAGIRAAESDPTQTTPAEPPMADAGPGYCPWGLRHEDTRPRGALHGGGS